MIVLAYGQEKQADKM